MLIAIGEARVLGMSIIVGVFFFGTHAKPRPCSLTVSTGGHATVLPGSDVSFTCSATCLGPLSHGQLIWKGPHGNPIAMYSGERIQTVKYNHWTISRLVVSRADFEDSGVYTCEVLHKGQRLQYPVVLDVEDNRAIDLGPKRGDIQVERDPDLPPIRPVRSVQLKPRLGFNGETRSVELAYQHDQPPNLKMMLKDKMMASSERVSENEDINTVQEPRDDKNSGNVIADEYEINVRAVGPRVKRQVEDSTAVTQEQGGGSGEAEGLTDGPPEGAESSPSGGQTTSATGTSPATASTTTVSTTAATTTATPAASSVGVNSNDGSDGVLLPEDAVHREKSTESRVGGQETDFGRYGGVAFGIAVAFVVLLVYILLLVLLVPRCCQRQDSHEPTNPDRVSIGGSKKQDDVILLGKRPHKHLAPMTSATGLNGEYITAVDLEEEKGGSGGGETEAAKQGQEAGAESKPQESFVSSFLIGRPSSGQPTPEETPNKAEGGGDDTVFTETGSKDDTSSKEGGENLEKSDDPNPLHCSAPHTSASSCSDSTSANQNPSADTGGSSVKKEDEEKKESDELQPTPPLDNGNDGALMSEMQLTLSQDGLTLNNKPTDV